MARFIENLKIMEIDKLYWRYKEIIFATPEQKKEHLDYEIWMFRETCDQLRIKPKPKTPPELFDYNLLVESLAIHTRILVDFFYCAGKDSNDIIAQDFMPGDKNWIEIRPLMTQILYDAREKSNKQLAHLSLWRIKIERDGKKGWDVYEISKDIENIIGKFEKATGLKFGKIE